MASHSINHAFTFKLHGVGHFGALMCGAFGIIMAESFIDHYFDFFNLLQHIGISNEKSTLVLMNTFFPPDAIGERLQNWVPLWAPYGASGRHF